MLQLYSGKSCERVTEPIACDHWCVEIYQHVEQRRAEIPLIGKRARQRESDEWNAAKTKKKEETQQKLSVCWTSLIDAR